MEGDDELGQRLVVDGYRRGEGEEGGGVSSGEGRSKLAARESCRLTCKVEDLLCDPLHEREHLELV